LNLAYTSRDFISKSANSLFLGPIVRENIMADGCDRDSSSLYGKSQAASQGPEMQFKSMPLVTYFFQTGTISLHFTIMPSSYDY
jgi:hypothetical protein